MNREKDTLCSDIFHVSLIPNDDFDDSFITKEEFQFIKNEMSSYENFRSVVIESLKIIQKRHGWVTDDAIVFISKILGISISDVEGVATFYNQIFRKPVGRHIIRFCDSIVCYISGCQNIRLEFESILHITQGHSTLDNRFTLLPVSCLGKCHQSPVIMINEDTYVCVLLGDIKKMLEKYL